MNAINQKPSVLDEMTIRTELDRLTPDISVMLPPGMPPDRFKRVALTAVQKVPKLLECYPPSLFGACLDAARDGLLPDGREGAIVPRWNKTHRRLEASWQPMVAGIQALAKRSGSVVTLVAHIVYKGEPFMHVMGDEEKIVHERKMECVGKGREVGVYAIATLKDGNKERESMTWQQVMDVKAVSDGATMQGSPWNGPFEGEMARKTAIKRLKKRLPSLSDGDDALHRAVDRVDDLYSFGRQQADPKLSSPSLRLTSEAPPPQATTAEAIGDEIPDRIMDAPAAPEKKRSVREYLRDKLAACFTLDDLRRLETEDVLIVQKLAAGNGAAIEIRAALKARAEQLSPTQADNDDLSSGLDDAPLPNDPVPDMAPGA